MIVAACNPAPRMTYWGHQRPRPDLGRCLEGYVDQLYTGQFNDSFAPITDGVAMAVQNYAHWLSQYAGPACVVTPETPGVRDDYRFRVLRYVSLPAPKAKPYRAGFPNLDPIFWEHLRKTRLDIVHAHCPFTSGMVARRLKQTRQLPMVATFHSKYRDNLERIFRSRGITQAVIDYVVAFYATADEVWVPSDATGDTLREYGYRGDTITVPNGSDMEATPTQRAALRREMDAQMGFSPETPVLLFVGQHIREKNTLLLIESLALLRDAGQPFQMLFVGDGYARGEMERFVAERRLNDRVRFLGLVRERETLRRLYARADLFTFPSVYDNAPLVVREAAACGTPSLLIEGCSSAEGVRDGVNGYLAPESASAYAQMLALLLDDREGLQRVGWQAQSTLVRSWQDIAQEVAWRYGQIVERYANRPHYLHALDAKRAPQAPALVALQRSINRVDQRMPWNRL